MEIDKKRITEIEKRISKLKILEEELYNFEGYLISITRLTVIKYLCQDSLAMAKFAYFISNKVSSRIKYLENDISLKVSITESIQLMEIIIGDFTKTNSLHINTSTFEKLDVLRRKIKDYQNIIENRKWTDVRIIKNWDIFIIEEAISCFIHLDFPEMGYKLAKSYTEKYNANFGSGLIPESFEYIKEINIYWIDYFYKLKNENQPTVNKMYSS